MSPVVTLTFSPCIDKSFEVQALLPDIKLSCSAPMFEPGGGGINVARALQKLGTASIAIYPCGGYSGSHFSALLHKENVNSIAIPALYETRQNEIIIERSTGKEFRFGMPCPALADKEWKRCLTALKKIKKISYIVISGSLPDNPPSFLWQEIAAIANAKKTRLIIDSKIGTSRTIKGLGVFLMKPNLHELANLAGKANIPPDKIKYSATKLIKEGVSEVFLVSMGASGAMLIDKTGSVHIKAPAVMRKSTVGAGDSMVAGLIHYLQCGKPLAEAARYAVACGTAATLFTGTQLCRKPDADRLLADVSINN